MRTVVAAIEIAVALLLLIGASLFVRSLKAMNRDDPGYRADHVVTMAIGRSGMAQEILAPWFAAIEREVAAVPGVRVVGFTSDLPLDGQTSTFRFTIVGDPPIDQALRTNAHYQIITQRRREFGIRLALGGSPRDVVTLVLCYGLRLTATGLVIGLVAAGVLVRSLSSLLFGVVPFDTTIFAGALFVVAITAMLSCLVPALRAARSNPAATLRAE